MPISPAEFGYLTGHAVNELPTLNKPNEHWLQAMALCEVSVVFSAKLSSQIHV
jgi:hypothetical protein